MQPVITTSERNKFLWTSDLFSSGKFTLFVYKTSIIVIENFQKYNWIQHKKTQSVVVTRGWKKIFWTSEAKSTIYIRGSQTFLVTEPFHIIPKVADPLFNSNENKGKFSYSYQQLPLLALSQLRICRPPWEVAISTWEMPTVLNRMKI